MVRTNCELTYQVSFATPAFLGNAEQQAQWRTPPFKALIRQWWRVVKAREVGFDVARLRSEEMKLFGSASDDGSQKSHQSFLRLRLSSWDEGKLAKWPEGEKQEFHPEVGEGGRKVGTELYLGYGALEFNRETRSTQLGSSKSSGKPRNAIDVDNKAIATLRVMLPAEYVPEVRAALQLAAWFGTLGSRARNGWGALHLQETAGGETGSLTKAALEGRCRALADCLKLEWPHAIGHDGAGPLVWQTVPMATWRDVMRELARLKIAFRTQAAPFPDAKPGLIERRHLISYPVTNHDVDAWGKQERLANQIRFKVVKAGAQRVGVIVHLPCRLPDEMARPLREPIPNELALWQDVHRVLDAPANKLKRLA